MMTVLKKLKRFFKRPKRYVILNLPVWVNVRGVFPGFMNGGTVRAELVDETEKALMVRYFRQYNSCVFGIDSHSQEYCEWMLKTDSRIVEVYEH